jgi:hypothetical protein
VSDQLAEARAEIERLNAIIHDDVRHWRFEWHLRAKEAEAQLAKAQEALIISRTTEANLHDVLRDVQAKLALVMKVLPDHGDDPCFCWSCNLRESLLVAARGE